MPSTTINPTRMELTRLKGRLKTAQRGHKLLKDKRDELMRQFMLLLRENQALREKVEAGLEQANASFTVASAVMSPEVLEQALLYPKQHIDLHVQLKNVMSVYVPDYRFEASSNDPSEIYPYGFAQTSGELDDALSNLASVFSDMLKLAQVEKSVQLMAQEIEKTRRRVNALEHVMIPDYQQKIRYISMKLDENERGATSRLMKVKDMMLEEERRKFEEKRAAREAERAKQHGTEEPEA